MEEIERSSSRPIFILLLSLAAIFIVAFGIRASAAILNPILLASVITIIALPLPARLSKRGLPGWLSFALTLIIVIGSIALVALLIFLAIDQLEPDTSWQEAAEEGQSLSELFSGFLQLRRVEQFWQFIISGFVNGLITMGMVLLIFIFMLSAAVSLPSAERKGLLPNNPALKSVSQLTAEVRRYMSITTVVNILVGLGDVILLWIVGVPYALLWGVLSWVMGYIPTVGFWIAMIPPIIVAWQLLGVEEAIIVFLGYVLINGSVQNFIQPRLMGQGLGISPVVVFISLFVWGWLLGGVGAILAVPLTLLIIAILESSKNTQVLASLMRLAPQNQHSDGDGDTTSAKDLLKRHWENLKSDLS